MTIELKPEQARILEEALRQGRFHSVEEALDSAFQALAPGKDSEPGKARPALSPSERAAAFRAWAENHPRNTPVLSDKAVSRETIYSHGG